MNGPLLGLLLASTVVWIYRRSLHGEFLTDDFAILDMEDLYARFTSETYRCGVRSGQWVNWRGPRSLTHLGYYWTWRVFLFRPSGWHGVNIGIHLVNTFLVFRLGELLGFLGAFPMAAVFALHPLQVPAVAWISGRAGIQMTMFAYAGWILLLTGFWPLAMVSQVLAQRSKEDAWVYLIAWPVLIWVG